MVGAAAFAARPISRILHLRLRSRPLILLTIRPVRLTAEDRIIINLLRSGLPARTALPPDNRLSLPPRRLGRSRRPSRRRRNLIIRRRHQAVVITLDPRRRSSNNHCRVLCRLHPAPLARRRLGPRLGSSNHRAAAPRREAAVPTAQLRTGAGPLRNGRLRGSSNSELEEERRARQVETRHVVEIRHEEAEEERRAKKTREERRGRPSSAPVQDLKEAPRRFMMNWLDLG